MSITILLDKQVRMEIMLAGAFAKKTLILTISNLITGTIAFLFSIYCARAAGSEALGLFQLVMPVYMILLFISGGGITISMSKYASECMAGRGSGGLLKLNSCINALFRIELGWSFVVSLLMIAVVPFLSVRILNDVRTIPALIALCPAILCISLSSIYKGTFFGLQRITAPAVIDIIEKMIRILIFTLLLHFMKTSTPSESVAAIVISMCFGELSSMTLFWLAYRCFIRPKFLLTSKRMDFGAAKTVILQALPLAAVGLVTMLFSSMMTILIPSRLVHSGMSHTDALSALGRLQGMTLTILFYPSVIISAVNTLLIPSMAETVAAGQYRRMLSRIRKAMLFSAACAFGYMPFMLLFGTKLGIVIYGDPGIGPLLHILAPVLPLAYLLSTSSAIMNGLGHQRLLFLNTLVLSCLDLVLIYLLVGHPAFGIKGYAVDFLISSSLGLLLNLIVIRRAVKQLT